MPRRQGARALSTASVKNFKEWAQAIAFIL
jgi:hypothetical protein